MCMRNCTKSTAETEAFHLLEQKTPVMPWCRRAVRKVGIEKESVSGRSELNAVESPENTSV